MIHLHFLTVCYEKCNSNDQQRQCKGFLDWAASKEECCLGIGGAAFSTIGGITIHHLSHYIYNPFQMCPGAQYQESFLKYCQYKNINIFVELIIFVNIYILECPACDNEAYRPVCGSDLVTYASLCHFQNCRPEGQIRIHIIREGRCATSVPLTIYTKYLQ